MLRIYEQDSILAHFQPYYTIDKEVSKAELQQLRSDYQTSLRELLPSQDYYNHLVRTLTEIYNAGIISNDNLNDLQKDSTNGIMVIDDKVANQINLNKIYSIRDAYMHLLTADTSRYNPDILRRCSLNDYLTPNLIFDEERTKTAKEEVFDR